MGFRKDLDENNSVEYTEQGALQVNSVPLTTIVNTEVLETGYLTANIPNGLLYLVDASGGQTGLYALENSAVITTAIYTNTNISGAKDTASKLNIYVETGEIKIQNLSPGPIDVTLSILAGGLDLK